MSKIGTGQGRCVIPPGGKDFRVSRGGMGVGQGYCLGIARVRVRVGLGRAWGVPLVMPKVVPRASPSTHPRPIPGLTLGWTQASPQARAHFTLSFLRGHLELRRTMEAFFSHGTQLRTYLDYDPLT